MKHYYDPKKTTFLRVNSETNTLNFIKLKELTMVVLTDMGEIKTSKLNADEYLKDCMRIPGDLYESIEKILSLHAPKPIVKK